MNRRGMKDMSDGNRDQGNLHKPGISSKRKDAETEDGWYQKVLKKKRNLKGEFNPSAEKRDVLVEVIHGMGDESNMIDGIVATGLARCGTFNDIANIKTITDAPVPNEIADTQCTDAYRSASLLAANSEIRYKRMEDMLVDQQEELAKVRTECADSIQSLKRKIDTLSHNETDMSCSQEEPKNRNDFSGPGPSRKKVANRIVVEDMEGLCIATPLVQAPAGRLDPDALSPSGRARHRQAVVNTETRKVAFQWENSLLGQPDGEDDTRERLIKFIEKYPDGGKMVDGASMLVNESECNEEDKMYRIWSVTRVWYWLRMSPDLRIMIDAKKKGIAFHNSMHAPRAGTRDTGFKKDIFPDKVKRSKQAVDKSRRTGEGWARTTSEIANWYDLVGTLDSDTALLQLAMILNMTPRADVCVKSDRKILYSLERVIPLHLHNAILATMHQGGINYRLYNVEGFNVVAELQQDSLENGNVVQHGTGVDSGSCTIVYGTRANGVSMIVKSPCPIEVKQGMV